MGLAGYGGKNWNPTLVGTVEKGGGGGGGGDGGGGEGGGGGGGEGVTARWGGMGRPTQMGILMLRLRLKCAAWLVDRAARLSTCLFVSRCSWA